MTVDEIFEGYEKMASDAGYTGDEAAQAATWIQERDRAEAVEKWATIWKEDELLEWQELVDWRRLIEGGDWAVRAAWEEFTGVLVADAPVTPEGIQHFMAWLIRSKHQVSDDPKYTSLG